MEDLEGESDATAGLDTIAQLWSSRLPLGVAEPGTVKIEQDDHRAVRDRSWNSLAVVD